MLIQNYHHLEENVRNLTQKVDSIATKVDALLENGQVTSEQIFEIKDSLKCQESHLKHLSTHFKLKIAKLNGLITGGTIVLCLLLLWIVFKV
tara:strand:+ start:462 stop:737 length:276 start_codon:yes stop_codon:yes gene_type:complete